MVLKIFQIINFRYDKPAAEKLKICPNYNEIADYLVVVLKEALCQGALNKIVEVYLKANKIATVDAQRAGQIKQIELFLVGKVTP